MQCKHACCKNTRFKPSLALKHSVWGFYSKILSDEAECPEVMPNTREWKSYDVTMHPPKLSDQIKRGLVREANNRPKVTLNHHASSWGRVSQVMNSVGVLNLVLCAKVKKFSSEHVY